MTDIAQIGPPKWGTGYGSKRHIVASIIPPDTTSRLVRHGYGRALCSEGIKLDYIPGVYEPAGLAAEFDQRAECSRCVRKALG